MSRGGGSSRDREPVGKGEGEETYACLPSLPWPPMVQDSCPQSFLPSDTTLLQLNRMFSLRVQRRNTRPVRIGIVNLQGEDRMFASDSEIGAKGRKKKTKVEKQTKTCISFRPWESPSKARAWGGVGVEGWGAGIRWEVLKSVLETVKGERRPLHSLLSFPVSLELVIPGPPPTPNLKLCTVTRACYYPLTSIPNVGLGVPV
jgi:hypothetical protein